MPHWQMNGLSWCGRTVVGRLIWMMHPQRVQDQAHVRVLIAKDAISTGWDCPRAEVLVSFRPARDNTHITQLLGRMVRNPTYTGIGPKFWQSMDMLSSETVAWGTPMPRTPRVVHAAPGPTPTRTPTAPVRMRCRPVE